MQLYTRSSAVTCYAPDRINHRPVMLMACTSAYGRQAGRQAVDPMNLRLIQFLYKASSTCFRSCKKREMGVRGR